MRLLVPAVLASVLVSCGPSEIPGTRVSFDLDGDLTGDHFFDLPLPSDLRLREGHPDFEGFPNPPANGHPNALVERFRAMAEERRGWPVVAAAYFHFDAPIAAQDAKTVYGTDPKGPLFLVDADPASPERGKRYPVVASTPAEDAYVPANLLAVAPRPGIVLPPNRLFAYVVMRNLNDAAGKPLGVPLVVAQAAHGTTLKRKSGAALPENLDAESLWKTAGIEADEIAALTFFTTGDVVADLHELSEKVRAAHPVTIDGLHLDPDDGATHPRFCELLAHVKYPQFQKGTPPFDSEGLFETGADGLPVVQREETAPVVISIPRVAMPAAGYPLMAYFHGSGGESSEVVDRGRTPVAGGDPTKGEGPAHVVAALGLASASAAFPVNPERLANASDFAYLNPSNLNAVRDTFRQGVLEQRLFLDALGKLEIPPETLAGCTGATLPAGAVSYRFDLTRLVAMGHSMGAMYLNMISAIEPRIRAMVSSGAGGYWTYFLMETKRVPNAPGLLGSLLGTDEKALVYLHPVMQLAETAIEPIDPLVSTPRAHRLPLPGAPARPVYEPVGLGDSYFPPQVLDTIATGYGNEQAGRQVWTSLQDALSLEGKGGIVPYPVTDNVDGVTGAVVQYDGDGLANPHSIAFQLDDVKFQYGCFLQSFLATGHATVPAPAPLGSPCSP